jgi:CNT family concentrative nucleoside transporter
VLLAAVLAGCGSGGIDAPFTGASVTLRAVGIAWEPTSLTLPANAPLRIVLQNDDERLRRQARMYSDGKSAALRTTNDGDGGEERVGFGAVRARHRSERALGTRGPAGLVATANIFLGQTEAPLLVRPYLERMSRYELLLVMTAGMATIAGSVMVIYSAMLGEQFEGVLGHLITKSIMSVPAAVLFAHIMIPDDDDATQALQEPPRIYSSAMDSITRGTSDGLALYLNIIAILIVLTAFVALANSVVGFLPMVGGEAVTLERIAGWIFSPIAWLMGIPWAEAATVGSLLGVKSVLNEFIAFIQLSAMPPEALSERSRLIAIYGLCGFANLASIGIQISGIGTMGPSRRGDLAELAWPAFVAATLGSCMTACVVGIVAG